MVRVETVFNAADTITPEFAARLSECATRFDAVVSLDCGGKQLQLDSLICILALELYRGVSVTIVSEGAEALEAAEEIRQVLEGAA